MADHTVINVTICPLTFKRPSLIKAETHFRSAFCCWCHHRFVQIKYFSKSALSNVHSYFYSLTYVSSEAVCQLGYSTAPQNKLCLQNSLRCPDIFPLAYSTYVAACIKYSRCFPQCPRRPMAPHLNVFCSFAHASICNLLLFEIHFNAFI